MRNEGTERTPVRADVGSADPAALLRSVGCRVTRPRLAVLRALLEHGAPLDAGRLTELAQRDEPGIHEATVYRTIGTLTDHGIVSHLHAGHGPALVRLSSADAVVAVCQDCGTIEELPRDAVTALVDEVRSGSGFELEPGHFALEGVCGRCLADDTVPEIAARASGDATERAADG